MKRRPMVGKVCSTPDLFLHMAALTLCFVGLDVGVVQGVIGDIHRPAAQAGRRSGVRAVKL